MTRNAIVLIIGNEILSGKTQDENLRFFATELAGLGIELTEARVIRDDPASIVAHVNEARRAATYVFTTGGIGPTHDDITAASIATAFGVELVCDEEAVRRLSARSPVNEARLKMCHVPAGASLIENPVSQAPGFQLENVFVLAGVPRIARAMFASLSERLIAGAPIRSASVEARLSEGAIASQLAAIAARFPDVEIGSYPFFRDPDYGVSVVARSRDGARATAVINEVSELMRALGSEPTAGDVTWKPPKVAWSAAESAAAADRTHPAASLPTGA